MVYADQSNYNFSISLSRGSWTLTAYYRDYSGQKTITVPGDNNIVIELK